MATELSEFHFSEDDPSAGLDDYGWAGDEPDPLSWLAPILWPSHQRWLEPSDGPGAGWFASPSAAHPNILIPSEPRGARRRAVRRYHDGFSAVRRLRSLTAEVVTSIPGVAERALQGAKVVEVPGPGAQTGPSGFATPGLLDGLRELLDEPDLLVAVSLSVEKSNRKPVLQLLTPSGRCLGWAKIGWNDRTRSLIGTEATWLQRPAARPLVTPELLHDVEIVGQRVVVTSGVEASRLPRRLPASLPAPALFRSVAALSPQPIAEPQPIEESAWWASVRDAWPGGTERELAAIEATVDACSDHRFELGAWHGDLTPWNLMTSGKGVQLIDWEFAADGVPIGFDLCHFHTQVGAEMRLLDAASALNRSARLSPQGLAKLGIAPTNHLAIYRLYLVELIRRSMALRLEGYPVSRLTFGSAALNRLERSAGIGLGRGRRRLHEVMLP